MRILYVQPTCDRKGHYGLSTNKVCQGLGKLGHTVTLCTNKAYPDRYLNEPPLFKIIEVTGRDLSFGRFDEQANRSQLYYAYGHFRNSYLVFREALKLAEKELFDVIHATGIEFMTASLLLKRYSGLIPPVVMELSAANFSFSAYPGSFLRRSYKVFQREVFKTTIGREIKAFTVLGEWHEERLKRQLRLKNGFEVAVIPDGGEEPEQPLDTLSARRKIGLDKCTKPLFLFFGTIRKDKGLEFLLDALSYLCNEQFTLLITGHPQDYTETQLAALIRHKGLEDKVIARFGYVRDDEASDYFHSCDALILPYLRIYTGGSGPLMKGACMHKRPSIVSDVAEMGRLVRKHQIGLVARPEDPAELAKKIREFINLPQEIRSLMAEKAYALAREHTWDKMAVRFTDLYRKVV